MDYVLHQPAKTVMEPPKFPGQVVLVFQGGGALGAYQGGVYQALHEAGIEPDWVDRHLDRRHQRRDHRRQRGSRAASAPARLLAPDREPAAVGRHTMGQARQPHRRLLEHHTGRHPRLLHAEQRGRLGAERSGRGRACGLLHDRRPAQDRGRARGLRACESQEAAADRRRGQCAHRQDALFRQPQHADHAGSRAGVGGGAAGLSGGPHRRRSLLGWRALFEHAGRGGVRRQSATRFGGVLGADFSDRRTGAGIAFAGVEPAEGHSVREPRRQSHSAPGAHPPASPHGARTGAHDAGSAARDAGGEGDRRLRLRHHDAHHPAQCRAARTRGLSARYRLLTRRHPPTLAGRL